MSSSPLFAPDSPHSGSSAGQLPEHTPLLILGAGPTGLEAAAKAHQEGHDFQVLEAGDIADSVQSWGHVRLFSPWSLNTSSVGRALLESSGEALPDPDAFPTGAEYVDQYLRPIARHPDIAPRIHTHITARSASRRNTLKGELIGNAKRGCVPLIVAWRDANGVEGIIETDALIDATGVYRTPNASGDGGIAAIGEEKLGTKIIRHLVDPKVLRSRFANKSTVVIGSGYSAATLVRDLLQLRDEAENTEVTWVTRSESSTPLTPIADDPLPERRALTDLANSWSNDPPSGLTRIAGVTLRSCREAPR